MKQYEPVPEGAAKPNQIQAPPGQQAGTPPAIGPGQPQGTGTNTYSGSGSAQGQTLASPWQGPGGPGIGQGTGAMPPGQGSGGLGIGQGTGAMPPGQGPGSPGTAQGQTAIPLGQGQVGMLPDPSARYRGWYPRWWLLSAFFCYLLFGGAMLLRPVLCLGFFSTSVACQFSTWTDWQRQIVVVLFIWAVFLIGWLVSHILGVRYVELAQGERTAVGSAVRIISEFKIIYPPLYIYGMLAFAAIVVTWITNHFESVFFALASITIFVVNSCYLYTRQLEDRRMYMLGYASLAIAGIVALILIGPFQPVIFASMGVIILVSLFIFFWTRPAKSSGTAPPPLTVQNAATVTVGQVVRSLVRAMRRSNRLPANNPTNQQTNPNQGNVTPP
ncbi:MAG: hypothetical protein ACRDIV_24785 [Ktedonobacteraceae bacterium]